MRRSAHHGSGPARFELQRRLEGAEDAGRAAHAAGQHVAGFGQLLDFGDRRLQQRIHVDRAGVARFLRRDHQCRSELRVRAPRTLKVFVEQALRLAARGGNLVGPKYNGHRVPKRGRHFVTARRDVEPRIRL